MFQNIDQQNNIPTSSHSKDEDELFESCNELPFNDSECIKNENNFDNIKCTDTYENNSLKTLKTIKTTSMNYHSNNIYDNKLIKTNNLHELSQLNHLESKYLIALCGSINANINSQDEKIILNMVQKNMRYTLPSSAELTVMNTQHFIDLNVHKAIHHLQEGPQQCEDVSKKQSVELMESDDLSFFTPSSMKFKSDTFINSKHNKDIMVEGKLEKSNEYINTSSKTDDDELINQDEDSEINAFRAMCEAMTKIGTVDKQVKLNSNPFGMVQNQMKNIVLKKMTGDVLIVNDDIESVPNTNKSISSDNSSESNYISDNSKYLKRKRHHCKSSTLNIFSDSSPEYISELSQKQLNNQNKKTKLTSLKNSSKIQSKSCSKKIENQLDENALNSIILTSSEDEENCTLIKSQSSKVNNTNIDCKHKSIRHTDSLEQSKQEQIFYCSPDGRIHRDMMNYLYQKNCVIK